MYCRCNSVVELVRRSKRQDFQMTNGLTFVIVTSNSTVSVSTYSLVSDQWLHAFGLLRYCEIYLDFGYFKCDLQYLMEYSVHGSKNQNYSNF